MVKKVHEYSEKYYLPTIIATASLLGELRERITKPETAQDDVSFYRLARVLYHWHIRALGIGGYFLRDMLVERVVALEEGKIGELFLKVLTRREASILIKSLKSPEGSMVPFVEFQDALSKPPLDEIFIKYTSWLKEKTEEVNQLTRYLQCYYDLLLFEVNRSYQSWYRQKARPHQPNEIKKEVIELFKNRQITFKEKRKLVKRLRA